MSTTTGFDCFPRQSKDRGWPTSSPARSTFPVREVAPMTRGQVILAWLAAIAVGGVVLMLIAASK